MPITLGILVTFVSLAVIALPFLRRSGATLAARQSSELERLTALRANLYDQIGHLQADHAANTIADEDYRRQLLELRVGAAETIRQLDQLGYEEEPQDAPAPLTRESLEDEIAALRRAGSRRRSRTGQGSGPDED